MQIALPQIKTQRLDRQPRDGGHDLPGVQVLEFEAGHLHGAVREGGVKPIGSGGEGVVGADVEPALGNLRAQVIAHHRGPFAEFSARQIEVAARLERLDYQAAGPGKAPAGVAAGLERIDAVLADAGGEIGQRNVDWLELTMQRQTVGLIVQHDHAFINVEPPDVHAWQGAGLLRLGRRRRRVVEHVGEVEPPILEQRHVSVRLLEPNLGEGPGEAEQRGELEVHVELFPRGEDLPIRLGE